MLAAANTQTGIDADQTSGSTFHAGLVMRVCDIERFLSEWSRQNHTPQTVEQYRNYLMRLYEFLPDNHVIDRDVIRSWRERLLQSGYSPSTVNMHISGCNTWLDYMGRWELQIPAKLEGESKSREALTREEYFRLLLAARAKGQERLFLIIKVFGSTGLYANELGQVTVENVREGCVFGREVGRREAGQRRRAVYPAGLRKELMAYAEREGITTGPLFRTREGNPVDRTTAARLIRRMGEEAGIPDGRATPSGLRLMYLTNRAEVEADAARMVEQTLERQAAQEQLIVGWNEYFKESVG